MTQVALAFPILVNAIATLPVAQDRNLRVIITPLLFLTPHIQLPVPSCWSCDLNVFGIWPLLSAALSSFCLDSVVALDLVSPALAVSFLHYSSSTATAFLFLWFGLYHFLAQKPWEIAITNSIKCRIRKPIFKPQQYGAVHESFGVFHHGYTKTNRERSFRTLSTQSFLLSSIRSDYIHWNIIIHLSNPLI